MNDKLMILLAEPDSYRDIVCLFEKCLEKNWHDHPPVVWANEEDTARVNEFQIINCGGGNPAAYCGRILKGLEALNTEYVLLWTADYIPTKQIPSDEINEVLGYMESHGMKFCQLSPKKKSKMTRDKSSPHFYHMKASRPYNISITFGIYEVEYLKSLIKDENWTAWQFENYGLFLANQNQSDKSIYFDKNIGETVHLVMKSKLIPSAVKELHEKGIDTSCINRPFLSAKEIRSAKAKKLLGSLCPQKLRSAFKKIAHRLGIKTVTQY